MKYQTSFTRRTICPALFSILLASFSLGRLAADTLADQTLSTGQPSLALTYFVDPDTAFVDAFAGNFAPAGTFAANGQLLSIIGHQGLFGLIGTEFGGDGVTNIAMPNLNARTAIGVGQGLGLPFVDIGQTLGAEHVQVTAANYPASIGGLQQPFSNLQPSLGLHYIIATSGVFPSPDGGGVANNTLGRVSLFAGAVAPSGWRFADGAILNINQNQALFSILGTTYGGNGITNFALPDFQGRAAIGAGNGLGLTPRDVGEELGTESTTLTDLNLPASVGGPDLPFSNMQPSLGMNFFISPRGIFPARDGDDPLDLQTDPLLAEVTMFAGIFTPGGWLPTDGRLISISQNTALFSLLGTQFGGNGITNFALPDLRGRVAVGSNPDDGLLQPFAVGDEFGTEWLTLSGALVPPDGGGDGGNGGGAVPEPSTFASMALLGLAGLIGHRAVRLRRRAS